MLEAAAEGARRLRDQPVGPAVEHRRPARVARLVPQNGKRQHRRGGVDVERRQAVVDVALVPILDGRRSAASPVNCQSRTSP